MNYSVENISDFNERFYTISDNLTDISENINKNLERLTKKSFVKKIIHKFFPQSSIAEIEVVYKELEEKEKILKEFFIELNKMKEQIKIENEKILLNKKELEEKLKTAKEDKNTNLEVELLEIIVTLESKLANNNELVINQLPVLTNLINTFLSKVNKTLPFLKMTLQNQLKVNSAIKTLTILIESVEELENFSKELERQNSKIIYGLIENVNKRMAKNIDIEYYKDTQRRNSEFKAKYEKSMNEYLSKLNELKGVLKESNESTHKFLKDKNPRKKSLMKNKEI